MTRPLLRKWCSPLCGVIQCSLTTSITYGDYTPRAMWILANERKKGGSAMSQEKNICSILTSSDVAQLPIRDRVGLVVQATDATTTVTRIREAEHAGVQQVWMTQSVGMPVT